MTAISKTSFKAAVDEILANVSGAVCYAVGGTAYECLLMFSEDFLASVFSHAAAIAVRAGRKTILVDDLRVAHSVVALTWNKSS